ncbi:MAG: ribonuclease PH [Lentisphaeria bacterium]|nr:ribonuclease PH [Lentisphaeria bacterium]
MRNDNRQVNELRPVAIHLGYQKHPAGSVLIECGNTRVLCAVSIQDGVPRWMREQNTPGGWLTCEYQMLPSATGQRGQREAVRGKQSGRTQEIQRLIGRSLRSMVDLEKIGARTLQVDCDVIDADGGTRCASITGACVALELAVNSLLREQKITESPIRGRVAAVSVGLVDGTPIADLCYREDARADVDMNVVMTETGEFIEVQGTAEGQTFSRELMDAMLDLAVEGIRKLCLAQKQALAGAE